MDGLTYNGLPSQTVWPPFTTLVRPEEKNKDS